MNAFGQEADNVIRREGLGPEMLALARGFDLFFEELEGRLGVHE
jgi:hypothetical protein